jgi:hypothetical protein
MVATSSAKKKKKVNYKEASSSESDSDDDVPLAALKKKPAPAVKKKANTPAKKNAPAKKTPAKKKAPAKKKKAPVKKKAPAKKKKKPAAESAAKKKYELQGQKRDPPDEEDSLRKFYVSLRIQRPDSVMAEVWLMEHGLLEDAKAQEKAYKAFMKRKTAPNTKSSIAGTVQPRRYLDEIKNAGNSKTTTTEVKKETPSAKVKTEAPTKPVAEDSSDDDVPLAKLAAQKA